MRMLRTNDWSLVRYYHANEMDELYDLKKDPGELTNLYSDPRQREVRARLQQRLDERMKAIRDPILRKSQWSFESEIFPLSKGGSAGARGGSTLARSDARELKLR